MDSRHNEIFAWQISFSTVTINIIKEHKLNWLVRLKSGSLMDLCYKVD